MCARITVQYSNLLRYNEVCTANGLIFRFKKKDEGSSLLYDCDCTVSMLACHLQDNKKSGCA
jgi:hypothetical protein